MKTGLDLYLKPKEEHLSLRKASVYMGAEILLFLSYICLMVKIPHSHQMKLG